MYSILNKHSKIALQLSGGKDSIAVLYLLREYLDKITVYHLNTGDQPKETQDVIGKLREFIPNYVEIKTNSINWIERHGYPSDVVPTNSTVLGVSYGKSNLKLQDRFSCCFNNLMKPMNERMIEDGVTLIIRGTKKCDMPYLPAYSGEVHDGIELFYPIENWSHDDVFKYLKEVDAPIHPVYEKMNDGIDCLHCTGWWESKHLNFLEDYYPDIAKWVKIKHCEIKIEVAKAMLKM